MIPEISEFSYGFALTNEIVGWNNVQFAPIFPSLIEEGKQGGGYDVKLDMPGIPLYLQFKRSEYMTRRSASQYEKICAAGYKIGVPFFRFYLMESWRSAQHELLLSLEVAPNLVFYAAPRFHKLDEINAAWLSGQVAARTLFVSPRSIGALTDNEAHAIAFDHQRTFFCSDVKLVPHVTAMELEVLLRGKLEQKDAPPLRSVISESLNVIRSVREKSRTILATDAQAASYAVAKVLEGTAAEAPVRRAPGPLEGEKAALREMADIATRDIDAQLVIVQQKN